MYKLFQSRSGGGAGGYRNSYGSEQSGANTSTESTTGFIAGTVYTITVGGGGAGAANKGAGGGGSGGSAQAGGAGGSGVVILRVPTAQYSGTTSGSPTVTTSGSDTIITFNASGSYTA